MWKQKKKKKKLGLGFLEKIMHKHEEACMRIIKPTHVVKIMCTWVLG